MAMVAQLPEIHVDPESETGKLLKLARERTLRLESGGRRFRLVPDEVAEGRKDPFADYDSDRALAAWRGTFGILRGLDIEAFKAEMREARGQDRTDRPDQ